MGKAIKAAKEIATKYEAAVQELRNKAGKLSELNSRFKAKQQELTEQESALCSMWEGAARDTFHQAFTRDRQQMDVFQQNQHLREEFIPWTEEAIRAYPSAQDAEQKNQMLRQILQKIMYRKHPIAEGKGRQYALSLDFYPAIPDAAVFAYKTQ